MIPAGFGLKALLELADVGDGIAGKHRKLGWALEPLWHLSIFGQIGSAGIGPAWSVCELSDATLVVLTVTHCGTYLTVLAPGDTWPHLDPFDLVGTFRPDVLCVIVNIWPALTAPAALAALAALRALTALVAFTRGMILAGFFRIHSWPG